VSFPRFPAKEFSVEAGRSVGIRMGKASGSMSILVPGQNPLLHRCCLDEQYFELIDWFSAVETQAWAAVNAYFGHQRPKEIFLVTGQILTSEYHIAHAQGSLSECEVNIEGVSGSTFIAHENTLMGNRFKSAEAIGGFENKAPVSASAHAAYSVLLQLFRSYPILPIRKTLTPRLEETYKYENGRWIS
jgi:hypothetical protein